MEYRGPSEAEQFLRTVAGDESHIKEVLANPKVMQMTREDFQAYDATMTCHIICKKALNGYSVRDYCHITGKYRGAAHNACDLKLQLNSKPTPYV